MSGGANPVSVIHLPASILGRILDWLVAHSPFGHSSPVHDLQKRVEDAAREGLFR